MAVAPGQEWEVPAMRAAVRVGSQWPLPEMHDSQGGQRPQTIRTQETLPQPELEAAKRKMKFTTGEIITAGLKKLCCPKDRLYAVMNFLTGDDLFSHQFPRAFQACEPWVKKQHPWLLELDESQCNPETWKEWLAEAERLFGKEHELEPLPLDLWKHCDPIKEAIELMEDKNKVIVVHKPE
jgi:hypothetical protein